jgi:hypothetical protein
LLARGKQPLETGEELGSLEELFEGEDVGLPVGDLDGLFEGEDEGELVGQISALLSNPSTLNPNPHT